MTFRKGKWNFRSLYGRNDSVVTMSVSVTSYPGANFSFTVKGVNFPWREFYGSWIFWKALLIGREFRQSLLHLLILKCLQLKIIFMLQWYILDSFIILSTCYWSQLALGEARIEEKVLILFLAVIYQRYFTFIVFLRGFLIIFNLSQSFYIDFFFFPVI